MTLKEAIRNGVHQIADIAQSTVLETDDGADFAFLTPSGLCLIGVTHWKQDSYYIDIRWRVLIGEITSSFDFRVAMQANHSYPETPYGMTVLDGKEILTITDTYRFLVSWGPEEIQNIVVSRFGGAFSVPLALPGVNSLPSEFFSNVLQKYDLNRLLGVT